jgi:GNAT superfamily N-acetyltransferase
MTWYTTGDLDEFTAATGDFLGIRPVANTILLTITENLRARDGRPYGDGQPLFGWWRSDGGGIGGAFLRTPPYPVVLSGVPAEAVAPLVRTLAGVDGINAERTVAEAIADEWRRLGVTFRTHVNLRLYRLGELTPPEPGPPGQARVAEPADRGLLLSWYEVLTRELHEPDVDIAQLVDDRIGYGGLTLWETDGIPVSLAGRTRAVAGMVRIGPVFTPRQWRRRGYGAAVTTAASRAAQQLADKVVLFTDLSNPTSNAIYQTIGYRPVHDRVVLLSEGA